jgi:hypothetical protein
LGPLALGPLRSEDVGESTAPAIFALKEDLNKRLRESRRLLGGPPRSGARGTGQRWPGLSAF